MSALTAIEICAGAGGQAIGLERAGFSHTLAIELDKHASSTLQINRPNWDVRCGDVASTSTWDPLQFQDKVDLLAGGVPCPPFTIAGKQLGANDERDLFAWAAVELTRKVRPRALLLENVRGLSGNRFGAYRQHVLEDLHSNGYVGGWRLLRASDFGVPQLRPRFVLVAVQREYAGYFRWPEPPHTDAPTVGESLVDLMGDNGWEAAESWAKGADEIAPTIVGGSKKHGGADLGPTRAKAAWAELGVDAMGVADEPPHRGWAVPDGKPGPKLTCEMVARIQGWDDAWGWKFTGGKTSRYRQIGNAFPPPVAEAVATSIKRALQKDGDPVALVESTEVVHDPVYRLLRSTKRAIGAEQIAARLSNAGVPLDLSDVERHLNYLLRDFDIEVVDRKTGGPAYRLGQFKAFLGQDDHRRHELFNQHKSRIS